MKGSPPLRAFVVLTVLLGLAWPLMRVTRPTPNEEPAGRQLLPAGSKAPASTKIPLVLSTTTHADRIEVRHLGAVVWFKENPLGQESTELDLPFPAEGIELAVEVRWPGKELAALRLQLTTPEGRSLERSVWGAETVEAVVSFP